jgi:hypothetical protein
VLTTTPGGADVTVDPVEAVGVDVEGLDTVGAGVDAGSVVGWADGVDGPDGSVELSACVPLLASDDDADVADEGDDGESPGVSAHATRGPIRRTAPTPSATARDPTRPTYAPRFI